MTRYCIIAVLCILVVYGLIEARPILLGPGLSIITPEENASFQDGVVTVSGHAKRATTLVLNGAPILHEENGSFSSVITLPRGGSILTFMATDRFGKQSSITRTVFVP